MEHQEYYDNLIKVIKKVKPTKGLEIGLAWGESAQAFLNNSEGSLISVDPEDNMNIAPGLGERHTYIKGYSPQSLPNDKFDWIYVDGAHDYGSVKADIKACLPLLKKKGFMCFDDYNMPDVRRAVDEITLNKVSEEGNIVCFQS